MSPSGKTVLMNACKATPILSGLRQRKTKSFLNGNYSNFFQSSGNFSFSGFSELYQSLKRFGASFSKFWAKLLNSYKLINPYTESQAKVGSQSRVFSTPGLVGHFIKKSISASS